MTWRTTVSPRRAVARLIGEAWVFDPLGALVRLPAVAACLAWGILTNHVLAGCLAAGGAFSCGFGAPLDLAGSRPFLLVVASLGISLSALVGSHAAQFAGGWLTVPVLTAFGALCGLGAARGQRWGWLTLQCGLAAIVATSYPASWLDAAHRAAEISVGGLLQAAALWLAAWARWRSAPPSAVEAAEVSHAWRLGLGLAVATITSHLFPLRNGYWVALTVLLVLRPDPQRTLARTVARTAGTVGGAALASLVVLLAHPPHHLLAVLVVLAGGAAYLFQKATYGLFSASVTLYVVFMLSFLGVPEPSVAMARVVATLVGSGLALGLVAAERLLGGMVVRPRR